MTQTPLHEHVGNMLPTSCTTSCVIFRAFDPPLLLGCMPLHFSLPLPSRLLPVTSLTLPLEVRPLKCSLGGLGSAVIKLGNKILVHFSLKIWHLVVTVPRIWLSSVNWPNFVNFKPERQIDCPPPRCIRLLGRQLGTNDFYCMGSDVTTDLADLEWKLNACLKRNRITWWYFMIFDLNV